MDINPNDPPVTETARDAARELKQDAEKTVGEIRRRGIKGFFSFEYMYFPVIARYVFIVLVVLSFCGMIMGVLSGLAVLVTQGVLAGLAAIVVSIVGGLFGILFMRIMFEMILLSFKIYEGVHEINRKTRG